MMECFDAHTHVHFPAYDEDRNEVIQRARELNIKIITVGTQAASSEAGLRLAREFPGEIWATAGFHPNHTNSLWYHDKKEQDSSAREVFDVIQIDRLAQAPEVVAIGECGLDYYRLQEDVVKEKEEQKRVFLEQVRVAEKYNKALMLHCRPSQGTDDAYEDILLFLTKPHAYQIPKVLHFYVGSVEMTKKFLDAGFYFTLGGVITFTREYDDMVRLLPIDRILLETDAPYVAPASQRGKRNEPAFILETAHKLAELKGLGYDTVLKEIRNNIKTVFGI